MQGVYAKRGGSRNAGARTDYSLGNTAKIRAVRRDEINDIDAGSKVTALQAWADAIEMMMEDHELMFGSVRSWKT